MAAAAAGSGHDKNKCGGSSRSGGNCARPAGWGTNHIGVGRCKLHGGSTPTHEASAQKTLAERAVRTYGIRRSLPPAEALLEEFEWSLGHVTWLRDIVADLEPGALVWGVSEEHDKQAGEFPGVDVKRLAAPSVWLKLYHEERRYLLDLGKTIETLQLENRRQAWTERNVGQAWQLVVLTERRLGRDPADPAVLAAFQESLVELGAPTPRILEGQTV